MDSVHVERIDHIAIMVTDLAAARHFYTEVLRLREVPRPSSFDFPGAWFQAGPEVVHLIIRKDREPESGRHFCFWTSDVQAAARAVAAAGHEVSWDTKYKIPGVDRFFTNDPSGNRIELQGSDAQR